MNSSSKVCVLVFSLLLMAAARAEDGKWRFPSDEITNSQYLEFRIEVLSKPDIERQEYGAQLVLISRSERKIYVFTEPDHPAHPAVVVRSIHARGEGSEIRRQGHYAGSREAFDTWWHQFDALDARLPSERD